MAEPCSIGGNPLKATLVGPFENRPHQLKDRAGSLLTREILVITSLSDKVGLCKKARRGNLEVPASQHAERRVVQDVLKVVVAGQ